MAIKHKYKEGIGMIQFTEDETDNESQSELNFVVPSVPTARKSKSTNLELEKENLALERERIALDREKFEFEKPKLNSNESQTNQDIQLKLKMIPFDNKKDGIVNFHSEFENICAQSNIPDLRKMLQPKTLLSGDARETQLRTHENKTKAFIARFRRRVHQYFSDLMTLMKSESDSYRGLMAKNRTIFVALNW